MYAAANLLMNKTNDSMERKKDGKYGHLEWTNTQFS